MFRTRSAPRESSGALRFLWLLVLLAAGCVIEEPAELRIINGKEPETLDPAMATGQADGRVIQSVFEGLTRYNETNAAPEPGLAYRWDISADGKIYTFHLRTNAAWSTGERITARDVEYSWFRVLDPLTASDYVGNLFYIKGAEDFHLGKTKRREEVGIQVLDDYTFRVELVNPTAFFLDLCAFPTQAAVHRGTIEKYREEWLKARPLPVSGPYELVSWRLNDRIRLKKNPHYWDAANVTVQTVDLFPVNSQNTALNLFVNNEVDIVWDKDVVPTELLDVLSQRNDFHKFDYLGTYFLRFNVTRPPFDDVRVRTALALAVDRTRIDSILKGGGKVSNIFVPPMRNYESPEGLGYDPERARQLLKEAGFEEGKNFRRFEYLLNTSRDHEKIAVQLQAMWKEILGIQMDLRSVEWKVYLRDQGALNFDISRSAWVADYSDPNTFLDLFLSNNPNNRTGWKNEQYENLMRTANATADTSARSKLLHEAERLLIREEIPIVPIYLYVGYNLFDPTVISGVHNEKNSRDEHPIRAIRKLKE